MQNNIKSEIIDKLKNLAQLSLLVFILSLMASSGLYIYASFTEPTSAPSASDQDFPENIIGANNADNDYDSSSVTASSSGSIIEYLEFLGDKITQNSFGRGWIASSSGDGSTALTKEACDNASDWEWFEDGNGDGDYIDMEDGICVQSTTTSSGILSWNGYASTTSYDNSYIADYECEGNFPNGTITAGTYNGLDSGGSADITWNDGDCALCQADCYDGKKDLPDQGSYTANSGGTGGYEGPITPEVLKNWKGTRLPTSLDFYGFCGYKDGGSNYETNCSSATSTGDYGQMIGRTDECLDLSNSGSWEWLSEQHSYSYARVAGYYACSYVNYYNVYNSYRFRAVFRP